MSVAFTYDPSYEDTFIARSNKFRRTGVLLAVQRTLASTSNYD